MEFLIRHTPLANAMRDATQVAETVHRFVHAFHVPLYFIAWAIIAMSVADIARSTIRGQTVTYTDTVVRCVLDAFFYSLFYTMMQHLLQYRSSFVGYVRSWMRYSEAYIVLMDDLDALRVYIVCFPVAFLLCGNTLFLSISIIVAADAMRRIRSLRDATAQGRGEPGEIIVRESHGYILCERSTTTDLDAIVKVDWMDRPPKKLATSSQTSIKGGRHTRT